MKNPPLHTRSQYSLVHYINLPKNQLSLTPPYKIRQVQNKRHNLVIRFGQINTFVTQPRDEKEEEDFALKA